MERSSEEKILGGLTHLAIFFSWLGLIANVVLYILYRPKSAFVAGHVKQAIGLQVLATLVGYLIGLIFGIGMMGGLGAGRVLAGALFGTAAIGMLLAFIVGIGAIVLAILAAIKGFQGEEHRHPLIGEPIAKIGE